MLAEYNLFLFILLYYEVRNNNKKKRATSQLEAALYMNSIKYKTKKNGSDCLNDKKKDYSQIDFGLLSINQIDS